ncbi:cation-translocating P-type ATPase [Mycolicibacterium elephantis]|nr:cation-translocating P-type ATPase [Mycolicibacterium elephantis]
MIGALSRLVSRAATAATLPVAVAGSCAASAVSVGVDVATLPARRLAGALPSVDVDVVGAVRAAVGELIGEPSRRCWRGGDRCWIEIRGLDGQDGGEVATAALDAVRAHAGVRSARLNVPLARLVVSVEGAEPTLRELCDVVASAEHRARQAAGDVSRPSPTDLPGDGVVLAAAAVAAAASAAGLCVAVVGRVMPLPRLPTALTAAVTLVDYQPGLRTIVENRLGTTGADTGFALAAATAYSLTQSPAAVAVECARHLGRVGETLAGARAWARQESVLARYADAPAAPPPGPRPGPPPAGPVERHAQRSGLIQALAAPSVAVASANLGSAAAAAVVAAPKAARFARESFASALGRGLADEHDVLSLRPEALRRLDRVDAVVIDPQVLLGDRLRVSAVRKVPDRLRAAAWQWAQEQIGHDALGTGWHRVAGPEFSRHNGFRGDVLIRHAHHPLAASLLAEVRRSSAELVSLDVDELDDLRSTFDELWPLDGAGDTALAGGVRRLQEAGHTVAVVSSTASQALSAADVAIGLIPRGGPPPWSAHVLAADLAGVWQLLHALPAARKASQRGVEIATGASLLGALLMVPGVRGQGPGPVTAGAAAGLSTGFWLARGALRASVPVPAPTYEWHAMSVEQVRRLLPAPDADDGGSPQPAPTTASSSSMAMVGRVVAPVQRAVWDFAGALRGELSDPLTPVLAVGSAASAMLGSPGDALLVGAVLAGNSALAAIQQVRAERLIGRLLAVQDPPARRVSNGSTDAPRSETVEATRLRPGDLIEVRPGEVVPADARLITADDLETDESSLTGESLPVVKQSDATPGVPLAERACMVYAGTTVVAGTAVAVVTAAGESTQAQHAVQAPSGQSRAVGLQTQLRELTNRALPVSLAGGGLVAGLGLLRRLSLRGAISSGVAVSVAAVPEGLPLVATLAQQASARRLTKCGALVRSPRAVEALGRIDVICFDKTGTLSQNRLRVRDVFVAEGFPRQALLDYAARATPPKNGDRHEHATDAAVVAASPEADATRDRDVVYLPFRSGRPYSASISGDQLFLKGAPELVLAACADPGDAQRSVRRLATDGLRVIAVAHRQLTAAQAAAARKDPDAFAELCRQDLRIVGLLGLSDTPREEAAPLLASLQDQQIGVRLITGDHPITATAIAAELGMAVTSEQVISGTEWEALSRHAQEQAVADRVVFSRMTPENKVQIVETLERSGLVCAMVGDGANDAAAIRAATVGIGVAARGSDPARSAADMMLLDGRIGSLLDAVDEGRQLWRRAQAATAVLLGGNAGEVAFAIVGTALTGRSPLNTRQLLLVNTLTDALPAAALAVSAPTSRMRSAGRGPNQAALWRTVAVRGATTAAAATSAWALGSITGRPQRASTMGLIALVSTQLGQTLIDSHGPLVVATAAGSLLLMGAAISTPGVSGLLGCTPVGPLAWSQALGAAGLATAAAAVAPRLLSGSAGDQPSISTTPARHSTAYNSRSGMRRTPATASVSGSEPTLTPVLDTVTTVQSAGVQTSNTP